MSDIPASLAEALYPTGPASSPQGPTNMTSWRGQPIDSLPPSADPRSVLPNASPARKDPPAPDSKTLGESLYGTPKPPDSPKPDSPNASTLPEGFEADPALMAEFNGTARSLRLDKAASDRLVQLHAKAVQGMQDRHSQQTAAWESETRSHFGDSLTDTVQQLRSRIGEDADGREFMRLMSWSGLGNNVSVLRVLERLARG